MIDVHLPTTDSREIILTRTTQPEPELKLLLDKLKLELPAQPLPKISAAQDQVSHCLVVQTLRSHWLIYQLLITFGPRQSAKLG